MILPDHLGPLPVSETERRPVDAFVDDAVAIGVVTGVVPAPRPDAAKPREVDGFAGRRDVPVISPFSVRSEPPSGAAARQVEPARKAASGSWAEQDWSGSSRFPAGRGVVMGMMLAAAVASTAVVLEWVVPRVDSSPPVPMGSRPAASQEEPVNPLLIEPEAPVLVFDAADAGVP